jgi:GGDEF domain-containing protein
VFIDRRIAGSRARHRRSIALMTCRLANHAEFIERLGEDAGRRLIVKVSEIVRDNLRGFDVVARIDDLSFGILFPEPGDRAIETITRLSHAIHDAARAELPADPPMQIGSSSATPSGEDGETVEALWEGGIGANRAQ